MKRENAKKWLPMIKAFAEGKTIEFLYRGKEWVTVEDPYWDAEEYRIKPEPLECWVVKNGRGIMVDACINETIAKKSASSFDGSHLPYTIHHMREVIE